MLTVYAITYRTRHRRLLQCDQLDVSNGVLRAIQEVVASELFRPFDAGFVHIRSLPVVHSVALFVRVPLLRTMCCVPAAGDSGLTSFGAKTSACNKRVQLFAAVNAFKLVFVHSCPFLCADVHTLHDVSKTSTKRPIRREMIIPARTLAKRARQQLRQQPRLQPRLQCLAMGVEKKTRRNDTFTVT